MNWYVEALRKYAVFSGRARRKEYWFFLLFNVLILIGLGLLQAVIGAADSVGGTGLLTGLYSLAMLLPSISVGVRRLHDIGRSGWWLLIGILPVIGSIVLLVFAVLDSQVGENQYGPNPKGVTL